MCVNCGTIYTTYYINIVITIPIVILCSMAPLSNVIICLSQLPIPLHVIIYGATVLNVIISRSPITSAKCDIIVHDYICDTKCKNDYWSYLGKGAKCDTTTGNDTLSWLSIHDHLMCFQLVCLLTPSVPMLYLKDPQIGNGTIHPELLLTVGVIHWNELPGFWQLKDKKNSLLTIIY